MCVSASIRASLAVWSCSTEMSADLCYSRGIRESVRHQKTRLLDSFPPEHPSSFHSYRTLHHGRGFPSCASERVTKTSLCNAGLNVFFILHAQTQRCDAFERPANATAAQSDGGIHLHYLNQLHIHNESVSSPDTCDAAHFTQSYTRGYHTCAAHGLWSGSWN